MIASTSSNRTALHHDLDTLQRTCGEVRMAIECVILQVFMDAGLVIRMTHRPRTRTRAAYWRVRVTTAKRATITGTCTVLPGGFMRLISEMTPGGAPLAKEARGVTRERALQTLCEKIYLCGFRQDNRLRYRNMEY